jgi:hypothetical protein
MAIFYGLYVNDDRLAAAFDLIRFLAEPNFFRRAHVTVRGPYAEKIPHEIEKIGRSQTYCIKFNGIGKFFAGKQNTVFLQCSIDGIENIWSKPDYGDGIRPHLTFYDGRDRNVAYGIFNALARTAWEFSVGSSTLKEISSKETPEVLDQFEVHQSTYDEILGRHLDYRHVRSLHWRDRLNHIMWVADFIKANYENKSA